MNHRRQNIKRILRRKAAFIILMTVFAIGSFATLGDGKSKPSASKTSLLSNRMPVRSGSFSLHTNFNYRGKQVINNTVDKKYINLNASVTLQKGRTTFIVPLKKKVVFDKIKIDISNRQFQKN